MITLPIDKIEALFACEPNIVYIGESDCFPLMFIPICIRKNRRTLNIRLFDLKGITFIGNEIPIYNDMNPDYLRLEGSFQWEYIPPHIRVRVCISITSNTLYIPQFWVNPSITYFTSGKDMDYESYIHYLMSLLVERTKCINNQYSPLSVRSIDHLLHEHLEQYPSYI